MFSPRRLSFMPTVCCGPSWSSWPGGQEPSQTAPPLLRPQDFEFVERNSERMGVEFDPHGFCHVLSQDGEYHGIPQIHENSMWMVTSFAKREVLQNPILCPSPLSTLGLLSMWDPKIIPKLVFLTSLHAAPASPSPHLPLPPLHHTITHSLTPAQTHSTITYHSLIFIAQLVSYPSLTHRSAIVSPLIHWFFDWWFQTDILLMFIWLVVSNICYFP